MKYRIILSYLLNSLLKEAAMHLTSTHITALKALIDQGSNQAADVLNMMTGSDIRLQIPSVSMLDAHSEKNSLGDDQVSAVQLGFQGAFSGISLLIFSLDNGAQLAAAITGEEPESPGFDDLRIEALTEVGNMVLNSVMGSIGNVLQLRLEYALPAYREALIEHLLSLRTFGNDTATLIGKTRFTIERLDFDGAIILMFTPDSAGALVAALDNLS